MFDHILTFTDEAAAKAALAPLGYCFPDEDSVMQWDTSRTLPGIKLVTADAVWDNSDPELPTLQTPEQCLPGWSVAIALQQISDDLTSLDGDACRIVTDSVAAAAGQPFIVWTAADINLAALATVIRVEPTLAGRKYDFSNLG